MNFTESAWFYVLRLQSGALYLGATKDLAARYKEHIAGKASRTTALDPPAVIIFSEPFPAFKEAPNEQRQFTEGKIPLDPPFAKGDDLDSLLWRLCRNSQEGTGNEMFNRSLTTKYP